MSEYWAISGMDRTRDQVLRTQWMGRRLRRFEDAALVTGKGVFVDDLRLPEMLWIEFARSNHPRGRIVGLNTSDAENVPGVVSVLKAEAPGTFGHAAVNRVLPQMRLLPFPLLPATEINAVGQPLAAVVATRASAAADAAALIEAEIEPLPLWENEEPLYRHEWKAGDVDRAFASAARVARVAIEHQRVAPAPLEPRTAFASWDEAKQTLNVWLATQTPHRARQDLAIILGLSEKKICVVAPDVGGAFGGKASIYPEDALVALAALRLKRPVKWRGSRSEDFLAATQGRGAKIAGELAIDASGKFLGLRAHLDYPLGHWLPYSAGVPGKNAARCLPGPYVCANVDIALEGHAHNTAAVGIYRGAGRPEAAMLMERLADEAARLLGIDPLDLRRRNLVAADDFPWRTPTGERLDSGDYVALLDLARENSDSDSRVAPEDGRLIGSGASIYTEPCGHGWESAEVYVQPDGRLRAATGSSAQGQGRVTAYRQIIADVLRQKPQVILIDHGDTATCPPGIGALASRSTAIGGSALFQAAEQFREKARRVAARLLQSELDHVDLTDDGFEIRHPVRRALAWHQLARIAHADSEIVAEFGEGLRTRLIYEPEGEAWASGCCIATVSIDRDTGELRVERIVWVDDAGVVVNPTLVEGQMIGGLMQGVGEATLERIVYDEDGQLVTASFMDYAMPRALHLPELQLGKIETPSPFNHLGAKGVGEAGCVGVPAAIVNAAVDALKGFGVTHLDMPLTSEKIWKAMQNGILRKGTRAMKYGRKDAKAYSREHMKGVWAAALTPFTQDFKIDEKGFAGNLDHWKNDLGIDGVFIAGKQGEFFSMSVPERKRSFEIAVDAAKKTGLQTIMSCSDQNMDVVIDLAKHAEAIGADYIVVHAPVLHFFKAQDQTLYEYYKYISEQTNIGIAMWSHPDSGYLMSPELCTRIAELPTVVAIKYSVPRDMYTKLTQMAGDKILVSTASEEEWLDNIVELGWKLYLCSNPPYLFQTAADKRMREYTDLAFKGDVAAARKVRDSLNPVREAFRKTRPAEKPHAHAKYWQELLGQAAGPVRRPMLQLTEAEKTAVRTAFAGCGLKLANTVKSSAA